MLKQHSSAAPGTVWTLWADTGRWPLWDPAVTAVEPAAPLEQGMRLRVETLSGTVTKSRITSVTAGASYVERSRMPFARVEVTRRVVATPEGSMLTASVRFGGLLGGFWRLLLGGRITPAVGGTLRAVADAAASGLAG